MHCRAPPAWEEELIGRPWKGDGTCAYYISVSMQEAEGPKRVAQRRFSKAEVWFGLAQPSGEAEGSPKTEPICDSRLGNGGVSQDHSWREQASSQFSAHRQGGSSRFWILKRVPDWRRAGCRQWVASTGPLPSKAVGPFLSIANATNSFCLWAGTERPHLCGRMWQWMAPVFAWRGYGLQASIPCPPETHDLPLRLHQMEKQHLQDPHRCDFFPHQTWNIKIFPLTGILRSGVHSCLGSKAFDLVCRGGKKSTFLPLISSMCTTYEGAWVSQIQASLGTNSSESWGIVHPAVDPCLEYSGCCGPLSRPLLEGVPALAISALVRRSRDFYVRLGTI